MSVELKEKEMLYNNFSMVYAGQFDPVIMAEAKQDVSELLNEKVEK